jgi:hypothetical protein
MAESSRPLQAVLPFRPEQAMMHHSTGCGHIQSAPTQRQAGFPDENSFFRLKP